MDDKPVDLKKLAAEATLAARADIRASKWCWLRHDWTRWEPEQSGRVQTRWCLGCGKKQRQILSTFCFHVWETDLHGDIVQRDSVIAVGHYYDQTCAMCGEKRRHSTYTGFNAL